MKILKDIFKSLQDSARKESLKMLEDFYKSIQELAKEESLNNSKGQIHCPDKYIIIAENVSLSKGN